MHISASFFLSAMHSIFFEVIPSQFLTHYTIKKCVVSTLAIRAASDPFKKVKRPIKDHFVKPLEEANGDVELARTNYIGYTLAYVKDAQPEVSFAACLARS